MNVNDKTSQAYWNVAETNRRGRRFDPSSQRLRDHAARAWHNLFTCWLARLPRGSRLIELGCGGSALLPYFCANFGFQVAGIDRSENGCALTEQMCRQRGCGAVIVCADLFAPPAVLLHTHEVVVSFGLVEHFIDTVGALAAFADFLVPGGIMITTSPNMSGWPGKLQRLFAPDIFEKHIALDALALARAHRDAGMEVLGFGHLQFVNFGVINPGARKGWVKSTAFQALRAITGAVWMLERGLGPLPPNRLTSPYIFCVAALPVPPVQSDHSC